MALKNDLKKFGQMKDTIENKRDALEEYIEDCDGEPIKYTKSYDSVLNGENLSPERLGKTLKELDELYNDYKNKRIIFQDEHKKLTEQEVKNMKNEKEKEIEKLKNEIEKLKMEKDISVDTIKTLKTHITDFKNKKQEEISQLKNEKQEEIINLKALHNEKLSDALHDVHLNYIIGIIIGSSNFLQYILKRTGASVGLSYFIFIFF
jgi:chromosome segregation ATPase